MYMVSINGEIFKADEARISVFDRGFLYGDQCCETMRVYNGQIFKLNRHLKRLENSLAILKFSPLDINAVENQIRNLLLSSELDNATVRLSVSRGCGEDGFRAFPNLKPNVVIIVKAYQPLPYDNFSNGVAVVFSMLKRISPESWPLNVKNTNLNNVLGFQEAQEARAYEAIMLNSEGYVTEGTTSNVFWLSEDRLYTPADYLGLLPGITREIILELAEKLGLNTLQGEYFSDELMEADEVCLVNSIIEVLPVASVDGKPIRSGSAGRFTSLIREAYQHLVLSETR